MLKLRTDYDAASLRQLARQSVDADQTRRLLALASIYDGSSRNAAAKMADVGTQIIRDWVERFNLEGPAGLLNRKAKGPDPKLNAEQREALVRMVESGPIASVHGVVRWRLVDLAGWVYDEYGISISETTLGRILKDMGYRKLSARPKHHGQNEYALEDFKKLSAEIARIQSKLPKGAGIELWFQDEARVGQKTKITRRWAKRGTRPSAPKDQRTKSAYIFGAICPRKGKGAGVVMPFCDSFAMKQHLDEISACVDKGCHAVLILDRAGWHTSQKLDVPSNITLLPLPAKAPELNPVENVWQFMRENWLSNRIFTSYADIVDHCCEAWNKLVDQPWRIMSIGMREWTKEF